MTRLIELVDFEGDLVFINVDTIKSIQCNVKVEDSKELAIVLTDLDDTTYALQSNSDNLMAIQKLTKV